MSLSLKNLSQNLLGLGVIALVFIIGFYLNPQGPNGVHGVFLPSVENPEFNILPARAVSDVSVVNVLPSGEKQIGLINTSVHFEKLNKATEQIMLQASLNKAKAIAASMGAKSIGFIDAKAGGQEGSPLNSFATQFVVIN